MASKVRELGRVSEDGLEMADPKPIRVSWRSHGSLASFEEKGFFISLRVIFSMDLFLSLFFLGFFLLFVCTRVQSHVTRWFLLSFVSAEFFQFYLRGVLGLPFMSVNHSLASGHVSPWEEESSCKWPNPVKAGVTTSISKAR